MKRFVVAGPPCSGKSTYVAERAQPGDVVYDYDTVHQVLSGLAAHQHDQRIRPYVLAARDAVLNALANAPDQAAWVITSSPKSAELRRLQGMLDADVILLSVNREEAQKRAEDDNRPPEWNGYIDNWFDSTDIDAEEWLRGGKSTMNKQMKIVSGPITFKADGEPGEFKAIFSTFNVIDLDRDVTLPGAFRDGQNVRVSYWGHRWDDLPVGRGTIQSDEKEAWINGQFFMDTEGGRETHQTVKNLGELQEWSYGFDVLESESGRFEDQDVQFLRKLDVIEVSPVMLGAGIGTRTEAIKSLRKALEAEISPEMVQEWHDMMVSLGAKCVEDDDSDDQGEGGDQDQARKGESRAPDPSTLAERFALELTCLQIEQMEVP